MESLRLFRGIVRERTGFMSRMERKIALALVSMTVWGSVLPAAAEMSDTGSSTSDTIKRSVTENVILADGTQTVLNDSQNVTGNVVGIQVSHGAVLNLGNRNQTAVTFNGDVNEINDRKIIGLEIKDKGSSLQGGDQTTVQVIQEIQANLKKTGARNAVVGVAAQNGTNVNLGKDSLITATLNSKTERMPGVDLTSYGLTNNGSIVELGSDAKVKSAGYTSCGIFTQGEGAVTTLGDASQVSAKADRGGSAEGVWASEFGENIIGKRSVITSMAIEGASHALTANGGVNQVGDSVQLYAEGSGIRVVGAYAADSGVNNLGENVHIVSRHLEPDSNELYGIRTYLRGTTIAKDGLVIQAADVASGGRATGVSNAGTTIIGNHASININTNDDGYGIQVEGGNVEIGDYAKIQMNGVYGFGILTSVVRNESSKTTLGSNASITVNTEQAGTGIASEGGSTTVGDNASVTVNGESGAGISSTENGITTVGKNATITVNGTDGTGIVSNNGSTAVGDNASVSAAGSGVESKGAGTVTFTGGANIVGGQYSLFSQDADSLIDLTAAGGRKTIQGNMLASDGGTIKAVLDTGNSFFTGASAVEGDGSELDLDLSNGAKWNMTGDSSVTSLALNSGAVVNMTANTAYQQLSADNFSGSNGIFYMETDLDSQTDGDKVHMTQADAGSSGKVQVYDASFVRGKEVTGTRHLLLITDDSGQASFTGETLNRGGLWDVTPTIQNGSYVRDTMGVADAKDTEWYLTKLEKKLNEDSRPLLVGGDNVYGMYRHSLDTLRQRRGNLRQRDKQEDADGIWVRDRGGRMTGDGWDSKYNIFQLGYEYSKDATSIYGIFGERGIASPDYKTGTGKEHTLAGGLYGTWFGRHDSYTDVVAKFGRDDSHISTFGPYPDSADYRTAEQSLSIEYGKTLYRGKHREFFIEPQAQLVFGHLNDVSYTTARRTHVERDDFNSTIGRLGFVLGKTHDQGRHPFDYYLKASVLHEFGNSQDVHMQSANGETLDTSLDYGETWFTVGFGGTYRLSPSATLYADGERTFSSDITTKWQVNAGLTWQF